MISYYVVSTTKKNIFVEGHLLFPYYAKIPKGVKVNEVFIQNHLMAARHDPLGRSWKFCVILVVIDF